MVEFTRFVFSAEIRGRARPALTSFICRFFMALILNVDADTEL
jgi:hypothetical protein